MKVSSITSNNLLHVVKKKLINAQELNNYLKSNPKCSRRIGSLPFDFFSQISNQNKSKITQLVGDVFENFALQTASIEETSSIYIYAIEKITKDMVQSLKTLLNRDDIKSSYVNSGSYKNCQRLDIGNYSYALSTFKKYPIFDYRGYFRSSHGKGNEPQNIFTTYHRYSKGRVCRPFLANISGEKDEGGFILSKFIDSKHDEKVSRGPFLTNRSFLKNIDQLGNSINGIFIEAGGFIQNKKYINDIKLRKNWQKFASCLDNNIEFLNKSSAGEIESSFIIALENGLDLQDKKMVNEFIDKLPQEKQKMAHKIAKQASRIDLLKQKAIQEGNFDKIKTLLKEDLCDLYNFEKYSTEFGENTSKENIFNNYPKLLTKIIEIDNVPTLKEMLFLIESHYCCIDIDLTKYYSKKDVKDLLANHYDEVKNLYAFTFLNESFKLNKNP